jgi:hypothetical protein
MKARVNLTTTKGERGWTVCSMYGEMAQTAEVASRVGKKPHRAMRLTGKFQEWRESES